MFYEVPQPSLKSIIYNFLLPKRQALDFAVKPGYFVIPASSGKAAMHLVLEWLRYSGRLTSRTEEILVPQWLGAWVYKTMHAHAFPNSVLTPRTKVIWVYHQYGFPQDMGAILKTARQRNLIVIEDCAHAIESSYQGSRVGTIGDYGIFSFSKFLPSLMGGAIVTQDQEARGYFLDRLRVLRKLYGLFCFWSKYFHEASRRSPLAEELLKTSYALYGYHTAMTRTVQNLIAGGLDTLKRRQENYSIVKRVLKGDPWIDSLPEDALPYVVPIRAALDKLSRLVQVIRDSRIYSGIYHFDEHRNLLNPGFVKVAWLPIHQAIPAKLMEKVSSDIKNILHPS